MFFHNGQIKSLKDAIRFYNTRDTNPELWYPVVRGVVQKLDDLPSKYRGNIDKQWPLDGRERGSVPAMSDQDMEDLETFIKTLTDDDTHVLDSLYESPKARAFLGPRQTTANP